MTRSQALLVAALVLAPLFTVLMRAVMRYLEGDRPRGPEPRARSVPAPVVLPPAPAPALAFPTRATLRGSVAGTGAETRALPRRWGIHEEARRGLVLMAILGPCHALDPPDA
jgi:hypothetical protein